MLYNGRATDVLSTRPRCDLCRLLGTHTLAVVDGNTLGGKWGYMCEGHFASNGIGLGEGVGQVLLCGDDMDDQLKRNFNLEDE